MASRLRGKRVEGPLPIVARENPIPITAIWIDNPAPDGPDAQHSGLETSMASKSKKKSKKSTKKSTKSKKKQTKKGTKKSQTPQMALPLSTQQNTTQAKKGKEGAMADKASAAQNKRFQALYQKLAAANKLGVMHIKRALNLNKDDAEKTLRGINTVKTTLDNGKTPLVSIMGGTLKKMQTMHNTPKPSTAVTKKTSSTTKTSSKSSSKAAKRSLPARGEKTAVSSRIKGAKNSRYAETADGKTIYVGDRVRTLEGVHPAYAQKGDIIAKYGTVNDFDLKRGLVIVRYDRSGPKEPYLYAARNPGHLLYAAPKANPTGQGMMGIAKGGGVAASTFLLSGLGHAGLRAVLDRVLGEESADHWGTDTAAGVAGMAFAGAIMKFAAKQDTSDVLIGVFQRLGAHIGRTMPHFTMPVSDAGSTASGTSSGDGLDGQGFVEPDDFAEDAYGLDGAGFVEEDHLGALPDEFDYFEPIGLAQSGRDDEPLAGEDWERFAMQSRY